MCFVSCNLYFVWRSLLSSLHVAFISSPYCVSNFLCNLFRTSYLSFICMRYEHAWCLVEVEKNCLFFSLQSQSFFSDIFFSAREIMLEEALMWCCFILTWGGSLLGRKYAWGLSQDEISTRRKANSHSE